MCNVENLKIQLPSPIVNIGEKVAFQIVCKRKATNCIESAQLYVRKGGEEKFSCIPMHLLESGAITEFEVKKLGIFEFYFEYKRGSAVYAVKDKNEAPFKIEFFDFETSLEKMFQKA